MSSLAQKHWLMQRLQSYQQRPLLYTQTDNSSYQYADLYRQILQLDQQFSDIKAARIVLLNADYAMASIACLLLAVLRQWVIVPVCSRNPDELRQRQEMVQADYLINLQGGQLQCQKLRAAHKASAQQQALLAELVQKQHAGLVLFSSGSTGQPKAMLHDFTQLLASYRDRKPKALKLLLFLMFDHIGGINTLLNILTMGAEAIIPASREPQVIGQLIQQHRIRVLPASPTFLNLLLMADIVEQYDLSSLRLITYGTEAMPQSLLLRLKQKLPRVKLLQTFGTSETGIARVSSRHSTSLDIRIDDENTQYKIVDGELWLKSRQQILGYLNAEMNNFEGQWFKTGDLVEQTDDGYIRIIGRKSERINVGGEKVMPAEVESVILELPQVEDCLVYAAENAITGQNVAADVVIGAAEDCHAVKKMIQKHCLQRLERYKLPVRIRCLEQLAVSSRFKKVRGANQT